MTNRYPQINQRQRTALFVLIGLIVSVVVVTAWRGEKVLKNSQKQEPQMEKVQDYLVHVPDRTKLPIQVGSTQLTVEVVNTSASITQGLSGRSEIGSDGMLFVFETSQHAVFWMKEMLFDLDLVWIHQGRVVGISAGVPRPIPGTSEQDLPLYRSEGLVDLVLELPAGKADETGIRPGDSVFLSPDTD
ncbi:DUF192 domain-containing protein [Candidatus Woesebacteria bacterium]|nr:DUF192 domain-containing protein [Candidatus Woesebacteria bacterium]